MAMPAHLKKNEERYLRSYITQVRLNDKLLNCDQGTLLGAMMTGAALGLDPSPELGQFYLVPYGSKCTFILGYHGMITLAYRGSVKKIWAHEVRENDEFSMEWGLQERLIHKPRMDGDRGKSIGYYTAAVLPNDETTYVYMTRPDVEAHARKYSMAYNSGPWSKLDQFDEMAKKTCLRQLFKWIPKSTELAVALSKEGGFVDISSASTIDSESVLDIETTYEDIPEVSDEGLTNTDLFSKKSNLVDLMGDAGLGFNAKEQNKLVAQAIGKSKDVDDMSEEELDVLLATVEKLVAERDKA